MKNLLFAIIFLTGSMGVFAYQGSPEEQVGLFFQDMIKGKSGKAIDRLFSGNSIVSEKEQQLTVLKQQLDSVSTLYGNFIGTENIYYEELSPSLTRIVSLAKHDIHPITWEFYFYKARDEWVLSQALFVDQFQLIGAKK